MTIFLEGTSIERAKAQYPEATAYMNVEGGALVFETQSDLDTWEYQK